VNPFDLRGPEFLLFYAACIATLLLAIWWLRRVLESQPDARLDPADPNQLAYLRDGPAAAVEVALMSLIDRGVLAIERPEAGSAARRSRIVQADPRAGDSLRRSFEKDVFAHFAVPAVHMATTIRSLAMTARGLYQEGLERIGLLASTGTYALRLLAAVGGILALAWLAERKISIAHARGHTNTQFLTVLSVVGVLLCLATVRGRTTVAGRRLVRSLQGLFGRLRDRRSRIEPGGATNELSMLAALYGLGAVSSAVFPHVALVRRPRPVKSASGSSDGSCGSSCGSAAVSSCSGSSCGGGGSSCGGGGGCGGCGS